MRPDRLLAWSLRAVHAVMKRLTFMLGAVGRGAVGPDEARATKILCAELRAAMRLEDKIRRAGRRRKR